MAITEVGRPPFTTNTLGGCSLDFTEAAEQHRSELVRMAQRTLGRVAAEDLVQEVVLSAWVAKRPPQSWRAWMIVILERRLADVERQRHRPESRVERPDSLEAEWPEPASDLGGQIWRWA